MDEKVFFVYILTNIARTVVYIGITNNLQRRIEEHRSGIIDGFTKKYRCNILVYFEPVGEAYAAITREKEMKGWIRAKKNNLICSTNPDWKDVYESIW